MECIGCHRTDDSGADTYVMIHKCPICFKFTCDNCTHRSMGRCFCSRKCAQMFFFGDEDE